MSTDSVRRLMTVETRAADTGAAVLDFVASSGALDRYHEVIDPAGWRLENYRRNPVFQNAHQTGDILFTLGKALFTEVRGGALVQRIQFAVEANPVARIAYDLYRGGFLNAVSVGFMPIRWENGDTDSLYRRKYLEQELLEVSAVAIPANPDAVALALRHGAIRERDLCAALEAAAAWSSPARLRYARELKQILQTGGPVTVG